MIPPDARPTPLRDAQNLKMAQSAHAYVRGSTAKFHSSLESGAANAPRGPAIWICGDCHLGNLGPLADGKGKAAVQIRDLDHAVIGNPAHDLIRLGPRFGGPRFGPGQGDHCADLGTSCVGL